MKKGICVLLLLFSFAGTSYTQRVPTQITVSISQEFTIVGHWKDDFIPNTLYRIRINSQKRCFMDMADTRDPNKWIVIDELTEKQLNGFRVFFIKDAPEQYYILERNGNLSVFDNYGHIATYKKIKL